jgi:alkylation response protein AidB-like acyl-CoA dehydrogenase
MGSTIDAPPADIAAGYLDRTKELLPGIAERADEAERTRRIPKETLDEFAAMDFFRVMVPRRYDGFELPITAVTEVGRLVGRSCASSGWVLTWLGWHSHAVAQYPPAVQDYVFRNGYGLVAGTPAPTGKVTRAEGGYRLTGRWSWATAVHHSEWMVLGGMVEDQERYVGLLVPVADLVVHDNWHTEGMRATGSDDVEAKDVFVSEDYVLDRALIAQNKTPGLSWNEGPLYRAPRDSLASLIAGAAGIGVGEWAIDDLLERLATRKPRYSKDVQGQSEVEQVRFADIAIEMRAASLLYQEASDMTGAACRGERELSVLERARIRMEVAHSVELARDVVRRVSDDSGSRTHFLHEPLQRAVRDIQTLSSHVVFNKDTNGALYAKAALGWEATPAIG